MKHVLIASALTAAILFGATGCTKESPPGEVDEPPALGSTAAPVPSEEPTDVVAEGEQEAPSDEAADQGAAAAETPPLGGELLPDSDDRPLTEPDLSRFTNWQLTLARNEIFARHGRPFHNAHVREHFEGMSWYTPDEGYDDAILSLLEQENADYILRFQRAAFETPAANP